MLEVDYIGKTFVFHTNLIGSIPIGLSPPELTDYKHTSLHRLSATPGGPMRYLILALLLGCSCATHNTQFHTSLYAEWITPPHTLEFCDILTVSENRILKQMDRWYDINPNYQVENIQYSTCDQPPTVGVIRFDKSRRKDLRELGAAAFTSWEWDYLIEEVPGGYNKYDYVFAATVWIRPGNHNLTIAHEIGHAWGWDHTRNPETGEYLPVGHLMAEYIGINPSWEGLEVWPQELH